MDNNDIEINLNDDNVELEISRENVIYRNIPESVIQEIEGDIDNLEEVVGIDIDTFSSSSTYAVGNTVVYNKKVYKCTTAVTTPGAWNASNWTEVSVKELIDDTNERIDDVEEEFDDFKEDVDENLKRIDKEQIQQNTLTAGLVPTNNANGESIDINDSGKYYLKNIDVEGQTGQESTTGKNLLQNIYHANDDTFSSNGITFTKNSDGSIRANGTATDVSNYYFVDESNRQPISAGTYIISGCASGGSSSKYRVTIGITGVNEYYDFGDGVTINVSTDNTYYFKIAINNGQTVSNLTFKPMIRLSSITDDTYEPYTGGIPGPNPSYPFPIQNCTGDNEILVRNINLCDNIWELGSIDGYTGQNVSNNSIMRLKNYIPVEELTNYKISTDNTGFTQMYVYEYKEDYSYNLTINKAVTIASDYFTTNANTKYVRIRPANFTPDLTIKVQLEQGSTATSYIPHEEQTVTFPLSEGQYMAEGDYLADDGIHHVWGQYAFKSYTVASYVNTSLDGYIRLYYNLLDNVMKEKSILKCNYLEYKNDTSLSNHITSSSGGNNLSIFISKDIATNEAEFQAWVEEKANNGNPFKVQYQLVTETIEPYTEAQQEAYDLIKKLYSYKDITHISQTNDGEPFRLNVIYCKDSEKIIEDLQGTVQDHEERITQLETDKAMLEDLIPTDTAEGESIDISDSAKYYFKEFVPEGQTSQETVAYIDVGTWEQGMIDGTSGSAYDSNSAIRTDFIEVKPNVLYAISRSINTSYMAFRFYNSSKNYLGTQGETGMVTTNVVGNRMDTQSSMEMTINNTSVAYMRMIDNSNNLSTVYTISTTAPTPEYPVPINNTTGDNTIKVENRNLLNLPKNYTESPVVANVNVSIQNNEITISGTASGSANHKISLVSNYTIQSGDYLHFGNDATNSNILFQFESVNNGSFNSINKIVSLESLVGTTITNVNFYHNSSFSGTIHLKPMILRNVSTATSYIPHEEQTATISLGSIEMNGIESYVDYIEGYTDNWKIVKKIKKTTLNLSDVSFANNVGYWGISDRDLTTTENQFLYCNKLFFNGNYSSLQNAQNYMQDFQIAVNNNGTSKNIFIRNSTVSTKEAFLTWINGLNATICYPLATPEEIAITDTTLINQLNLLEKLMSYKGVTHISQENDNLPFNLKVVYRVDPSLELDTIKQAIISLGGNV